MRTSFVPVRPMVPLAAVHVKGPTTCVQQGVFTRKPVSRGDAGIGSPGALAPSSPSGAGGYVLAPSAPVALRGTAVSDGPAWVRTRRLTLGALSGSAGPSAPVAASGGIPPGGRRPQGLSAFALHPLPPHNRGMTAGRGTEAELCDGRGRAPGQQGEGVRLPPPRPPAGPWLGLRSECHRNPAGGFLSLLSSGKAGRHHGPVERTPSSPCQHALSVCGPGALARLLSWCWPGWG